MSGARTVLLDRDGVINRNIENGYVSSWPLFAFVPGSLAALRTLKEEGYRTAVISNQAGVGKGLYSSQTLTDITERMLAHVREAGGEIERVYYCTHTPEENCPCRKPRTGLFEQAARDLNIPLAGTFFIGDSAKDVEAAHAAGCRAVLVLTGNTRPADVSLMRVRPEHIAADLAGAVSWIIAKERS